MNITLLANRDIASCLAVNYLLQGLQGHQLSLFLSARVGSKPLAAPLQHLKFVEQDLFNKLLFPLLPESKHAAGAELLGFDQLQGRFAGGVQELDVINTGAGLEKFAATEPDLVLSVRFGLILREPALAVPGHGVLNLHSGHLPDYKGVMATFWALLNGESEIGTTLHYIDDSSIDAGRIIASTTLPVDRGKSYLGHVLALYRDGCRQMVQAVQTVEARSQLPACTQAAPGNYYSFPTEADLEAFTARGWRLYDPDDVLDLARRFLAG
ncbi:MAG: formyl transferase [Gammaproteobacteria bacterium]|jgi:methionyl-tRNA formyltransferase